MNKLEDLLTLSRLLKEFELPVSPILEYAIKDKIAQLSEETEGSVSVIEETKGKTSTETDAEHVSGNRRKKSRLQIYRDDDSVIEFEKASQTFCQAIKEIGVSEVYGLKIPMDGMHLVTKGGNPQYPTAQHEVGNGYFVNVHSNNITKKHQLDRIFKSLSLAWRVIIVESE